MDKQFDFKKAGVVRMLFTLSDLLIVIHCVANGSTVNLCALNISKACDRMNHCGLFIKFMQRGLHINLAVVF